MRTKADAVDRDAALAQRAAQIAERFLRRAARRPGTEQPVEQRPDVYSFVSHRLDSMAPGMSGRRSSTPRNFSGSRVTVA